MNYVDLGALGIMLFSVGMGFFRGLIWEILKYAALAVSILLTGFVIYKILPYFGETETAFWWLAGVGFMIFVTISSITLLFVNKLSKLIGRSHFALTDKLLGSLFGAIRASFFILFLYSGLMLITMNEKPTWMKGSVLISPLDKGNAFVQKTFYKLASDKVKKVFKLDKLNDLMKFI